MLQSDASITQARSVATDQVRVNDDATTSRKIAVFDEHGQFRNALAPRGGVAFDQTAGARFYFGPNSAWNLGADPFSLVFVYTPAPVTVQYEQIFNITITVGNEGGLQSFIDASGNLIVRDWSTYPSSRTATLSGFGAAYAGKAVLLVFTRDSSGVLKIYVNGQLRTLSEGTSGSSPTPPTNWAADYTGTTSYMVLGSADGSAHCGRGKFHAFTAYNLALSQADITEIFELGGAVAERFKFGSQNRLYTSNFSAGIDNWRDAGSGALLTGNTDGIGGQNDNLLIDRASSYGQLNITRTSTAELSNISALRKIRISGSLYIPSATYCTGLRVRWDDTGTDLLTVTPAKDTWTNWAVETTHASNYPGFRPDDNNGYVTNGNPVYLRDIKFTALGAVVHLPLDDGLGYQLQDVSTNRLHALMTTSGITHVAPLYGPARVRTTTNTNGNQQLCGGTVLPGTCQVPRVRARAQSNTPTVTLGTASGGSQVVASVALSTTWKDLTIALTGGINTSAASLWAGSNSTDVVEWDITWEPLSP